MNTERNENHRSAKIQEFVSTFFFCVICVLLTSCAPSLQTSPWVRLGVPDGQNTSALTVDLRNLSTAYCGSLTGEFFISTNHGKLWTKSGTIPGDPPIHSLLQYPDDANRLYAATELGLFETRDAGKSWQSIVVVPDRTPQPSCLSIALDPWQPTVVFAGLKGHGLSKSTDGGTTWAGRNGNPESSKISTGTVEEIFIHPSQPDLLYANLSTIGAFRSTNGGESWVNLTGRFSASGTVVKHLIVSPENPELLCIGTGGGDIYRSENGGETWELSLQGTGYSPVVSFAREQKSPDILYASTASGVLQSDNFGGTWTAAGKAFPRIPAFLVTAPDSTGSTFYLYGSGTGIRYVGNHGSTWSRADSGLASSLTFSTVVTSHAGDAVYGTSGSSIFRHDKSGWVSVSDGLPGSKVSHITVYGVTDSLLYASTSSGPYFSENAGMEWRPLGKSMGGTAFHFIAAHPTITNRLLGMTSSGMMVSTDKGVSWNRAKPPLRDHEIMSMTFHPANAGIIGAGTANSGALVSSDGGINWDESKYGLEGNEILSITFAREGQTTYYAWGSDGKGYQSSNRGIEWAMVPQSWLPAQHFAIARDDAAPSSVIAFVNQKDLYYSDSGGMEWVKLPTGPPPFPMTTLSWNERSRMLFAGSPGEGLFRLSLKKEIDKALKK